MADINVLSRLVNAVQRNVDLQQNSLLVGSLKVGTTSPVELTKTILTNLVALQNGTDFSTGTNAHTHDGRYFTESELGSSSASSGSDLIGDDNTYSNFTPSAATIKGALSGIDAALLSAGGTSFSDATFEIYDNVTPSKKIIFQASGITAATSRTITMPDADVNLGALTNSNIDAAAAIAYSKLNLALSIVNGDINASAAIAYSKLNLSASIVNADVNASAAIAESKLALDYSTSSLNTAIGLRALDSAVIKKDGSVAFTAAQSMGGFKLTNVADPTLAQDSATKAYVDSLIDGRSWKNSVKVATTAALTLASDFENGDSVDGYVLVTGNRILIKNQASASENGIYIVQASGAPVRASDSDSTAKLSGAAVFVEEGTDNGDKQFAQTGDGATFAINSVWVVTSANSFSGHDMISLSGGQISVDLASDAGLESSNSSNAAGQLRVKLDGTTLSRSASGLKVAALGITNSEVSASAAIAYSKLDLALSIVNGDINASAAISYSKLNLASSIVNADIASGAAIAYSKLDLALSIVNADISASAAIAYSKLNLSASIVNADISASAAIAYSKLALSNSIAAADLTTGVADQSTITGGNGSALAVQHAPAVKKTIVSDVSMAANTSFAVRLAVSGETAGRYAKADQDATSSDLFYVVGIALSTGAVSAGGSTAMISLGTHTLGSSDTNFGAGDIGKPVFLTASGAFSVTAPTTANHAVVRIGMVEDVNKIFVQPSAVGVN